MNTHRVDLAAVEQVPSVPRDAKGFPSSSTVPVHAAPEAVGIDDESAGGERDAEDVDAIQGSKGRWFAYLKTREFYTVLLLGYGHNRDFVCLPGRKRHHMLRCIATDRS